MMIKARKITIVEIDNDNQVYQKEAVEFYDENTNDNIDPTKASLTQEEIFKMTNDAFNGS